MLTKEAIMKFMPPKDFFKQLISFLDKHVSKFDKTDKFLIAGYNVNFDIQFLREFFNKMGHKYYGSYFFNHYLDVMQMAMIYSFITDKKFDSFKLCDVAKGFNLSETAFHSASADINITRELFLRLMGLIRILPSEFKPAMPLTNSNVEPF